MCASGRWGGGGDSGGAEHVADHEMHFPGAVLRESAGQKAGQTYTAANGSEIANEREFDIQFKLGGYRKEVDLPKRKNGDAYVLT